MTYYYLKDGSQWRWHLKAANHKIIAEGEGYKNEADFSGSNRANQEVFVSTGQEITVHSRQENVTATPRG